MSAKIEFTRDALAAAHLFKNSLMSPTFSLTFKTKGNIHPRMRGALDELLDEGAVTAVPYNSSDGIVFRATAKMSAIPKITLRELKIIGLPMTVN